MTSIAAADPTPAVTTDPQDELDGRWQAWVHKGHAADALIYKRLRWMAWIVLGLGILSWPAWAPAVRP